MGLLITSAWIRWRWGLSGVVLAAGCWLLPATEAAPRASREYDLKAAFLYNLASFVEWPQSAFASPDAPFVIGVLGNDPFGPVLDEIVRHEFVARHPFDVRRFRRVEEVADCHLLFVAPSEARRVPEILRRLRGRPVLTVSDLPAFVQAGGMIGIGRRDDHLELFVNPPAVQAAALTVSSKLLELARVEETVAVSP
jgi:hypothetical protein